MGLVDFGFAIKTEPFTKLPIKSPLKHTGIIGNQFFSFSVVLQGQSHQISCGHRYGIGVRIVDKRLFFIAHTQFSGNTCFNSPLLFPDSIQLPILGLQGILNKICIDFFNFLGVKTLAEARALETDYIQQKWDEYGGWAKSIQCWLPVKDDKFVKNDFFEQARQNAFEHVPMMTGQTTDEFKVQKPGTDQMISTVKHGIWEYRKILESTGHSDTDIWYYEFDVPIPGWDRPGKFHSVDLWFWFETLAKCWRPFTGVHYDVARQMCNYLCNFIKTGNPNGKDYESRELTLWGKFDMSNTIKMVFDTDCHESHDKETIV